MSENQTSFSSFLYPASAQPLEKLGFRFTIGVLEGESLKRVIPQEGGFLMSLSAHQPVEFYLIVQAPRKFENRVWAVSVSGRNRRVIQKRDRRPDIKKYVTYIKKIRNRETREVTPDGFVVLSTKHEGNNTRLVIIAKSAVVMWELAIVTRILEGEANFYFTVQELYRAEMYNAAGEIWTPRWRYDGWPSFYDFLKSKVNVRNLPDIWAYKKPPEKILKLGDGVAVVEYFCLASGLGAAKTKYVLPALFHWRDIVPNGEFAMVVAGQKMTFEEVEIVDDLESPTLRLKGLRLAREEK